MIFFRELGSQYMSCAVSDQWEGKYSGCFAVVSELGQLGTTSQRSENEFSLQVGG